MVGGASTVQALYVVSAAGALGLFGLLWQHRQRPGAIPLLVGALAAAIWAAALLGRTVAGEFWSAQFYRLMYVGVVLGPAATTVFALEYTGRERYVNWKTLGLLSIHPVLTLCFVVFTPGDLFYGELVPQEGPVNYHYTSGPLFDLHVLYSYLLVVAAVALVLAFVFRSRQTLYLGQAVALAVGSTLPVLGNGLYVWGPVDVDITPMTFLGTVALYAVAIVRYRLVDVSPIARNRVIDTIRDGMFVVDPEDRIVDSNPAARRMIGREDGSLIGCRVWELFEAESGVLEEYERLTAEQSPSEQRVRYGDRYLNVQATPIADDRQRHSGWLFLLQDVTDQVQRERDLEEQIEKLDQFASLVSHDLRNPMNVVAGYVQQARATGNVAHLQKAEDGIERMEAIIDDVLALARDGREVTDPGPVSLRAVATDAWESVETSDAALDRPDDVTVVADRMRLRRLFENLFRNAVEHGSKSPDSHARQDAVEHGTEEESDPDTASEPVASANGRGGPPAGLTVTVGVTEESPTDLTIFVADDGVGIPEGALDRVFEDGYTTASDGTGLGLAIVEGIAAAHGWEVAAIDSDDGGARFELRGVAKPI